MKKRLISSVLCLDPIGWLALAFSLLTVKERSFLIWQDGVFEGDK